MCVYDELPLAGQDIALKLPGNGPFRKEGGVVNRSFGSIYFWDQSHVTITLNTRETGDIDTGKKCSSDYI